MNKYIICIDGGGTKTLGVLYTVEGKEVKRVEYGFSNFGIDLNEAKSNVLKTIVELNGIIKEEDELLHIELGISGASTLESKEDYINELMNQFGTSVDITNDAVIALHSIKQNADRNVILVIGGTGSVILVREEDTDKMVGGFGHLLGDEGSGYHLSITALKKIISEYETTQTYSDLSKAILNKINADDHFDLKKFVYISSKSEIAELSLFIAEIAKEGNKEAINLFVDEGKHLARQAKIAYNQMTNKKNIVIGLRGGFVLNAPFVKETFVKELEAYNIDCEINVGEIESIVGAYYLALKKIRKGWFDGWY